MAVAGGNFESKQYVCTMPKKETRKKNISFFSFMRYTYIMLYVWERENKKQFEKNGNFLSYLVLLSQDRERQCFKQCFYLEF